MIGWVNVPKFGDVESPDWIALCYIIQFRSYHFSVFLSNVQLYYTHVVSPRYSKDSFQYFQIVAELGQCPKA